LWVFLLLLGCFFFFFCLSPFLLGWGWFGVLPFDVFVSLPRKMCKYFWIDRCSGFCFLPNYGLCLMKLEQKKYLRLMKQMGVGLSHNIEF
jgi:hypothetical protein